jgi:hypothetical protein
VEAVAGEITGCHVLPNFAGRGALDQEASDQLRELPLSLSHVLVAMQKGRQL